ncbi:MAG: hypothetical protein U1F18_06160 [Steroidobacteraceae bacterium]
MDDFSRDLPFDASVTPRMVVLPYALDSNDMKMWNAPAFMPRDWLAYCKDTVCPGCMPRPCSRVRG